MVGGAARRFYGRHAVARVMPLLEDGERLRVVVRILYLSVVGRLLRSYQDTEECTRRQGQGRSRMTTPTQDRFLVLLSRCNHMSTAKSLEIDLCRATEVHLPDQIVRNALHSDGTIARRPAQGPVRTAQQRAVQFNFALQHHNWQIHHMRRILLTVESSVTESTNDRRL